jgi:hypothetical protein
MPLKDAIAAIDSDVISLLTTITAPVSFSDAQFEMILIAAALCLLHRQGSQRARAGLCLFRERGGPNAQRPNC